MVDVDSAEQAAALEARFPVLTTAPRESTKRGKHYFFARSARCDRDGYYDGHGQREKGVDFKTVRSMRRGVGRLRVLSLCCAAPTRGPHARCAPRALRPRRSAAQARAASSSWRRARTRHGRRC